MTEKEARWCSCNPLREAQHKVDLVLEFVMDIGCEVCPAAEHCSQTPEEMTCGEAFFDWLEDR